MSAPMDIDSDWEKIDFPQSVQSKSPSIDGDVGDAVVLIDQSMPIKERKPAKSPEGGRLRSRSILGRALRSVNPSAPLHVHCNASPSKERTSKERTSKERISKERTQRKRSGRKTNPVKVEDSENMLPPPCLQLELAELIETASTVIRVLTPYYELATESRMRRKYQETMATAERLGAAANKILWSQLTTTFPPKRSSPSSKDEFPREDLMAINIERLQDTTRFLKDISNELDVEKDEWFLKNYPQKHPEDVKRRRQRLMGQIGRFYEIHFTAQFIESLLKPGSD